MVWVLATALLALLGAGLLDLLAGVRHATLRPVPYLVAAAASVLLVVVGAAGISGARIRLGLDSVLGSGILGFGPTALSVDRLSGLFLVISFAVAVPVGLVCAAWAARPGRVQHRSLAATHCLVLGSVTIIITAQDAFVFLLAWELLTIAFSLLASFERAKADRADAAIITVTLGKVSGAALLLGFLLLATRRRVRAAGHRVRRQGRGGSAARLDAPRLPGRPRAAARGDGRGRRQRRLLWDVAHPCAATGTTRLASRDHPAARRFHRAAGHRARHRADRPGRGGGVLQH
jgi:hypothetical protein